MEVELENDYPEEIVVPVESESIVVIEDKPKLIKTKKKKKYPKKPKTGNLTTQK